MDDKVKLSSFWQHCAALHPQHHAKHALLGQLAVTRLSNAMLHMDFMEQCVLLGCSLGQC